LAENFFRVHADALTHPKFAKVKARYRAAGALSVLELWSLATKYYPGGRIKLSAKELGTMCHAPGDVEQFIAFLIEIGFLEIDGEFYLIHNWARRQPFIATAEERSERNRQIAIDRWAHHNRSTAPADNAEIESKRQKAQTLVDSWNVTVRRLPKVEKLNAQRIAHVCARLKEHSPEEMVALFKRLDDSDLAQKWGSFDWVTKSEFNLSKLSEGQYDNRRGANGSGASARPMPTGAEYLKTLENSN
jgi:hypothetical protein